MPLEGVSASGPLLPHPQLAEAAALGAFESKVEQNTPVKKPEENEKSKEEGTEENKEDSSAGGRYSQEGGESEEKPEMFKNVLKSDDKRAQYTLNFNKYTEMVELVDLKTGNVIESMSPGDLISLVLELKVTSGMFIDKAI